MRTRPKPRTQKGTERQRMLGEAKKEEIRRQEEVLLTMKAQGASERMIARALGVDQATVNRIWQSAMAEWNGDHRKLVDMKFAEMLAAHEAEIRESYVWGAKKPAAAALVRHRARVAISRICGHGSAVTIEHTGAGGGPIVTSQLAPMDAAALVRKAFSGIEPFTGMRQDEDGGDGDTKH